MLLKSHRLLTTCAKKWRTFLIFWWVCHVREVITSLPTPIWSCKKFIFMLQNVFFNILPCVFKSKKCPKMKFLQLQIEVGSEVITSLTWHTHQKIRNAPNFLAHVVRSLCDFKSIFKLKKWLPPHAAGFGNPFFMCGLPPAGSQRRNIVLAHTIAPNTNG